MLAMLVHQILPACLVLGFFFFALHRLVPRADQQLASRLDGRFWLLLAICMLGVYASALAFDIYLPMPIDFVEATIASVSYLSLHGHQLYTSLDATDRYSLLYGPLCYLPYAQALAAFGPTLASLKLAVLLFNLGIFSTLWFVFRRFLTKTETLVAMAFVACAFMMKGMSPFMIRGDVQLAFGVALGLLATSMLPTALAVMLFSVSCAYAIDIKCTAVFYFLVPYYFLWRHRGPRPALLAAFLVPVIALLPFAMPSISLYNYLGWLHEATHHPLSLKMLAMNLVAAVILQGAPLLMFVRLYREDPELALRSARRHALLIVLFIVSLCGSVITGSKLGAGRSHLNPTFIISAFLAAKLWTMVKQSDRREPGAGRVSVLLPYAFALYALFFVLPAANQLRDMWGICVARHDHALAMTVDIDAILRQHPGTTIQMGYDKTSDGEPVTEPTLFHSQLVFAGNPLTVDPAALADMGLSHVSIPSSTVDYVRMCKTQIWLVPRDGEPFSTLNEYAVDAPGRFPDPHMFTLAFRNAFFSTYRKVGASTYYDLWQCSRPSDAVAQR
jgi:hypothetical protein